ncbi:hypothetical protein GTR04_5763 [Trichophyton interdigitale]|nr:hypothetical protein GY631_4489 [Trichophyton interdigitale]KAG5218380.1 hypothetical protein GY632_5617 [Trichophyton interdigitale]KAG8206849.1 hypothetical protein GTR04_5763 [Trichophyton interdigitale]
MPSTALSFASSVPPVGTELPWPEISPDGKARSSRGSSDDNEELRDTLVPTLLVVPKKQSADEDWLSVSREIYQLLETNDLSQFNVEICDERVTTLSIIMPSNPAPPEPLPCVRCLGNLYAVTNPNCNPWLTGSMGSPT